jgi:hypothetical protein
MAAENLRLARDQSRPGISSDSGGVWTQKMGSDVGDDRCERAPGQQDDIRIMATVSRYR